MVILHVWIGTDSWWVINIDAKCMHEYVLSVLALPGVLWMNVTVGWYVGDPWSLAVFKEFLADDGQLNQIYGHNYLAAIMILFQIFL